MIKPTSIEGIIRTVGDVQTCVYDDGITLIATDVNYNCKNIPYQGRFTFFSFLGEEVTGREFELKQKYDKGEDFPITQFLRIWNPNGVGCRDYHLLCKDTDSFSYQRNCMIPKFI